MKCPNCEGHNMVALCIECEKTMQLEDPSGYNGWANYPTWRVIAHFDNTTEREFWQDTAMETFDASRAVDLNMHSASNHARGELATKMRDTWLEEWLSDEVEHPSHDLLSFAIKMIDFTSVADTVLSLYCTEYKSLHPARKASR
jgi:hypothetical protein